MPTTDGEHRRRRDKHDRDARPSPRSKTSYRSPTRTSSWDQGSRTSSSPRKGSAPVFVSMPVPEFQRRTSSGSSYPSFSKAHSRESVRSLEDIAPKPTVITPDATDLGHGAEHTGSPKPRPHRRASPQAPPSPPLSAMEEGMGRSGSAASRSPGLDSRNGSRTREGIPRFSASRSSLRLAEEGLKTYERVRSNLTPGSSPTRKTPATRQTSGSTDSDATTVGPTAGQRPQVSVRARRSGQLSENGSNSTPADTRRVAPIEIFTSMESGSEVETDITPPSTLFQSPIPPPPPPAIAHLEIPKVDYLLQNGGLSHAVPKSFAAVLIPSSTSTHTRYTSPLLQPLANTDVRVCFGPFHNLLDDYATVINKRGSLAVATGYRSVTRRLLDRLEQVFARNLPSSSCGCVICRSSQTLRESANVSWSEVFELVSGRIQLPQWPPFLLITPESGLGLAGIDVEAPMQRLDVDVPDEYREHYIRQSKKTKIAVQNWLACQPEDHASPPSEVDDETLVFAMLTYLAQDQRSTFMALLKGLSSLPPSRAPTPIAQEPKSDLIPQTRTALQRLYRLPKPPRDPETAMFLLKNPPLHNALATIAALSTHEWEILVSGRFDESLAEDYPPPRRPPSVPLRTASRSPLSPAIPRPPSTPRATDADAELAAIAEIEREVYQGMEALEDAFEALHSKAETVRRALRERSAGLIAAAAARSHGMPGVEARLGTPAAVAAAHAYGGVRFDEDGERRRAEDGDGISDVVSELAPDDSASNVGFRERQRHRRRRDDGRKDDGRRRRRTPVVFEEDEA